MAPGRADGGRDPARIGASGAIGERAASAKKGAARAALAAISEDASRVNSGAFCVMLRSSWLAPRYTCVRTSRKLIARHVDNHADTESALWMRARAQLPTDDAKRCRCVNDEIVGLFFLGAHCRMLLDDSARDCPFGHYAPNFPPANRPILPQ
jgi:hypothetical protein